MSRRILRTKRRTLAPSLLVAMLVVGTSGSALADRNNFRIYTGTMCGLRGDDLRAGRWADLAVSQFGWMGNNTADGDGNTTDQDTRDLHFVCPIERRARRSARGVSVMVRYMDTESIPSPGETRFCCTLHNARPGITPLGSSFSVTAIERDCESLDSAGFGSLLIEMPESNRDTGDNTVNSGSAGGYSLTCLVPPGARLIDYTVREND